MTEFFVCDSLHCVFFFVLSSVTVGSTVGLVVFLEVVASYAGEEVGAYGSRDSHQVVSAQSKKENKRQSSICCKKLQTLGLYPLFDLSLLLLFLTFTFTFSHLADAFIQSDLQLGNT